MFESYLEDHSLQGSPFRFEEAFKVGNFSFFFLLVFETLKFYIFLVIPGSWGVHRYPWFQNQSINIARADPDKKRDKYELRFII